VKSDQVITVTTGIAAPPPRVWGIMSNVALWHTWTASIRRIKLLEPGPLGIGKRALVFQPKLPPAVWRVTVWEGGRRFVWVSVGPGLLVTGEHIVQPSSGGSTVTLSVRYSGLFGGLFHSLVSGITQRYVELEAAGLKKESERTI